jgi:hypothetical protein
MILEDEGCVANANPNGDADLSLQLRRKVGVYLL